jgi:hypothetical protein
MGNRDGARAASNSRGCPCARKLFLDPDSLYEIRTVSILQIMTQEEEGAMLERADYEAVEVRGVLQHKRVLLDRLS